MKKIIASPDAPQAIGPYSQAVVHNGLAYLSGQIPMNPATNTIVEGGIVEQTERVFQNLAAVLAACGSSFAQVLKCTVFLKDMEDFYPMNEIYRKYFPENPPARATIQAAKLPRDVRVEIDMIAACD